MDPRLRTAAPAAAAGVHETPAHVVSYLVSRTLGRLVEDRMPGGSPLTVLDPACGAGAILIGAYRFLLDWHLLQYTRDDPARYAAARRPRLHRGRSGAWQLTSSERLRILMDHVYGVDIDPEAIEAAKRALVALAFEDTASTQPEKRTREKAVRDLCRNLKCGDSLIGRTADFEASPRRFCWQTEFPRVFEAGGFSAVIANPPYLSYSGRQAVGLPAGERAYFRRHYDSGRRPTTHGLFVERVVRDLAAECAGFVVPDQVGHLDGYRAVRDAVRRHASLVEVRFWGEGVFEGVITPTLTFITDRSFDGVATVHHADGRARTFDGDADPWSNTGEDTLLNRLREGSGSLGTLVADPGVHTGNCARRLVHPAGAQAKEPVPVLEGRQVGRYRCDPPAKVLDVGYQPAAGEYFTLRPAETYARARFVIRQTAPHPIVGPRLHATHFRNSLLALFDPPPPLDVRFHVALLNSRLMRWVWGRMVHESGQQAFPQVKVRALRRLPIQVPDLATEEGRAVHDGIVSLVDEMLALEARHQRARTDRARAALRRAIESADHRIDEAVYRLYGLDDAERARIDSQTPTPRRRES